MKLVTIILTLFVFTFQLFSDCSRTVSICKFKSSVHCHKKKTPPCHGTKSNEKCNCSNQAENLLVEESSISNKIIIYKLIITFFHTNSFDKNEYFKKFAFNLKNLQLNNPPDLIILKSSFLI
ncbi:MAG: hypothetical protein KDK36_16835 [Leptospiraceae bacterium]|nr:hypothetical protein [Leptospiraceae bacterium]